MKKVIYNKGILGHGHFDLFNKLPRKFYDYLMLNAKDTKIRSLNVNTFVFQANNIRFIYSSINESYVTSKINYGRYFYPKWFDL